ncbi:DUF998 domain-containing protein [Henriciella sp. AS95]|uniref:DUF998 domain-containing protein n=1 Tax=Henriciella sp. AS95 TaxID=3135782 RepID=UPI00316BBD6B
MLLKSRYIHYYVIASCLVAGAIDLTMAIAMNRQSLLTSTISDLAAGDFASAQDIGLILVAIAIALTGLIVWRTGDQGWPSGIAAVLFGLTGPLIILISLYEAYSKTSPENPVIHYYAVAAIGIFLAVALAILAIVRGGGRPLFRYGTLLAALIYLLAGAATFGVSNDIIGLVERLAAIGLLVWLLSFHIGHLVEDE